MNYLYKFIAKPKSLAEQYLEKVKDESTKALNHNPEKHDILNEGAILFDNNNIGKII